MQLSLLRNSYCKHETLNTVIARRAVTESRIKHTTHKGRPTRVKLPFPVGKTVRVKPHIDSDWKKAEVTSLALPHRSHEVKLEDGSSRRRTYKHTRISPVPKIVFYEPKDTMPRPDHVSACNGTSPTARVAVDVPSAAASPHPQLGHCRQQPQDPIRSSFDHRLVYNDYIEKNCIQSIQCCTSRCSKTAKIKCYKL